jgi:hypothetical protein
MTSARGLVAALLASILLALFAQAADAGEDRNFAGSAQLDYHFVPSDVRATAAPGPGTTFQGFTLEAAAKLAVDISDHLSANVKVCFGCHGFELDMAYFDLRAADELNLRFGRFSPSFGAFNLRHDPANHLLSDKPLPYDMGRMLRKQDWNNGVLPSPFPSNGAEVNGTHWMGNVAQLDYAVYAVTGFKNDVAANPLDLDFQESHLPYYVTSDPSPAGGARLALTIKAAPTTDVTLGASGMYGSYNPANTLTYAIGGADFSIRIARTTLRAEYLLRRQEFSTSDPGLFKYALAADRGDFFVKHGAFIEIEQPVISGLDLLGRVDGLYRAGNVPAASPLTDKSSVVRETLGLAYAVERNLRLKGSVEVWEFSYRDTGHQDELSFHLAAVGSF